MQLLSCGLNTYTEHVCIISVKTQGQHMILSTIGFPTIYMKVFLHGAIVKGYNHLLYMYTYVVCWSCLYSSCKQIGNST